eukprot:15453926-Alexandrium_andersonii.AAC.1
MPSLLTRPREFRTTIAVVAHFSSQHRAKASRGAVAVHRLPSRGSSACNLPRTDEARPLPIAPRGQRAER